MHISRSVHIIVFSLNAGILLSQDFPSISDFIKFPPVKKERGNTIIWPSIVPSDDLEIYLLEDFESNLPWEIRPRRANSYLHRFVFRNPIIRSKNSLEDKNIQKAYLSDLEKLGESADIHRRSKIPKQNNSYELRCNFESPGKDFVVFYPSPLSTRIWNVQGMPRIFALWVKGSRKKHKLYALFSSHDNKSLPVYMGDLNFVGWQRLEQVIPSYLVKRNPYKGDRYEITFRGLKIQSHRTESQGVFIIAFDLLMLFVDHTPNEYPGHQMKDFD